MLNLSSDDERRSVPSIQMVDFLSFLGSRTKLRVWNGYCVCLIVCSYAFVVDCFRSKHILHRPSPIKAKKLHSSPSSFCDQQKLDTSPLLIRAAAGLNVERIPVWMMRQAGRHMKAYRDIVQKYPTFRERSENSDVATEISLQPWKAYGVDGCIMFSDILTPLKGMGVAYDIVEKLGPRLRPITSMADVEKVTPINPVQSMPFIAKILRNLREEVGSSAAVLGFVGLPFTMATYLIEGGPSTEFKATKEFAYRNPAAFSELLRRLALNIADYANFQIENGAELIQVFDSWAAVLSPYDYDSFAAPYQRMVIDKIKCRNPSTPVVIYIAKSGALLEKMSDQGADVISIDSTVSVTEAQRRIASSVGIQGNLDPATLLLASDTEVVEQTTQILSEVSPGRSHIMNLGHGIDAATSEDRVRLFVDTVRGFKRRQGNK